MKTIIKQILKEEYNTKLKDFVYNYFDKKIESGEWGWIQPANDIFLVNSDKRTLLRIYDEDGIKKFFIYNSLYDKFVEDFSIQYPHFKSIIEKYLQDRLIM